MFAIRALNSIRVVDTASFSKGETDTPGDTRLWHHTARVLFNHAQALLGPAPIAPAVRAAGRADARVQPLRQAARGLPEEGPGRSRPLPGLPGLRPSLGRRQDRSPGAGAPVGPGFPLRAFVRSRQRRHRSRRAAQPRSSFSLSFAPSDPIACT